MSWWSYFFASKLMLIILIFHGIFELLRSICFYLISFLLGYLILAIVVLLFKFFRFRIWGVANNWILITQLAASILHQNVEYRVWTRVLGGNWENFEQFIIEILYSHRFLGSFLGNSKIRPQLSNCDEAKLSSLFFAMMQQRPILLSKEINVLQLIESPT